MVKRHWWFYGPIVLWILESCFVFWSLHVFGVNPSNAPENFVSKSAMEMAEEGMTRKESHHRHLRKW